jgi:hypothetical protein
LSEISLTAEPKLILTPIQASRPSSNNWISLRSLYWSIKKDLIICSCWIEKQIHHQPKKVFSALIILLLIFQKEICGGTYTPQKGNKNKKIICGF